MSYDADVIAEWDAAARSRHRQAHIHPSGRTSAEAYAASGDDAARHLAKLYQLAGLVVVGSRILDYGCGDGRVALPMARLGARMVGMDSSPAMLSALAERPDNERLTCSQVHPEADVFHPGDHRLVPGWPISSLHGDGSFDGAYCLAVLIHQRWEAAEQIIGAIAAELRPGGVLILDAPCYEDEEEGGSAFGVTTFSPERLAGIATDLNFSLSLTVNPGGFAGKPGPVHDARTVMVAPS